MKNLKILSHGIGFIDAHYVQDHVACIYFLQQNNKICIIETGTANSVPFIKSALKELELTFKDVEYIIPTHIHLDHAGGAGELMKQCPNATLVIHPRGAAHMIDPQKLEAGTIAVYGKEKFKALYGSLTPIAKDRIIIAEDNFSLDFNGRMLRFLDTPGHALHHFSIFDETSKGIFTGDTFGLAYKTLKHNDVDFIFATTTPTHFDPDAMLNSIDRILALDPQVLYLTHFGDIKPTTESVLQLKKSIHQFVAIAQQHKDNQNNRIKAIEDDIMQWMIDELKERNHPLSPAQIKRLLAIDCQLNAQGLDVWLKRQEKNK